MDKIRGNDKTTTIDEVSKMELVSGNKQLDGIFYLLQKQLLEQYSKPQEDLVKISYKFRKLFMSSIIILGLGIVGVSLGLGLYLDLQNGPPAVILDNILTYSIGGAGIIFSILGILLIIFRLYLKSATKKFIHSIYFDIFHKDDYKKIGDIVYEKCEDIAGERFIFLEKKFSFKFNNKQYNCRIGYKNGVIQDKVQFYYPNGEHYMTHYIYAPITSPLCKAAIKMAENNPFTFDVRLETNCKPNSFLGLFIPKLQPIDVSIKLEGITTIEELERRSEKIIEETNKANRNRYRS